jgi:hypothetical protein
MFVIYVLSLDQVEIVVFRKKRLTLQAAHLPVVRRLVPHT